MHHPIDDRDVEQKDEIAEQLKILMNNKTAKRIDVVLGDTNCGLKTFDPELDTPELNIGRWILVKKIAILKDKWIKYVNMMQLHSLEKRRNGNKNFMGAPRKQTNE